MRHPHLAKGPGAFAKQDEAKCCDLNRSAWAEARGEEAMEPESEEGWEGGWPRGFFLHFTYCENTKGSFKGDQPHLTSTIPLPSHDHLSRFHPRRLPRARPGSWTGPPATRKRWVSSQPQPQLTVCSVRQVTGSFPPSTPPILPTNLQSHEGENPCVQLSAEEMLREGQQLAQVLEVKTEPVQTEERRGASFLSLFDGPGAPSSCPPPPAGWRELVWAPGSKSRL